MLNTFQLVHNDKVISPILTTTREYGRWLETFYNASICQLELYCKSKKRGGEVVLESHPGTKIGNWFDRQVIKSTQLQSWFIYQDSTMMDRLKKLGLAEYRDAIPIAVNDEQGRRMLRVYTIEQIQLYIQCNIDRQFTISDQYLAPKQVRIRDSDFKKLIIPEIKSPRRSLF